MTERELARHHNQRNPLVDEHPVQWAAWRHLGDSRSWCGVGRGYAFGTHRFGQDHQAPRQ